MGEYRYKRLYGFAAIGGACLVAFSAALRVLGGDYVSAGIVAAMSIILAIGGVWSLRAAYITVGAGGVSVRSGGVLGSSRFLAWPEVTYARRVDYRLDLVAGGTRPVRVHLDWLADADADAVVAAIGAQVQVVSG